MNVFPPCIYTYVCEHHFWKKFVSTKMIITHRDIIHPYYQYIHQSETTPTLKTKRYPIGKSTDIYSSQPPSTSCKKIYGPIKLFSSHRIVWINRKMIQGEALPYGRSWQHCLAFGQLEEYSVNFLKWGVRSRIHCVGSEQWLDFRSYG